MAVLNQLTIGDILYLIVDTNPTSGGGYSAPIGSTASYDNAGTGEFYLKTGSGNTAWTKMSTGTAFQSGSNLVRTLTLTDFNESIAISRSTYISCGQIAIDKANYAITGSTLSFVLDMVLSPSNSNGNGNMRLYNLTDSGAITNSTTSFSANGNTDLRVVTSGTITNANWPTGQKIIEFQANDTGPGSWNLWAMQLGIYNTF